MTFVQCLGRILFSWKFARRKGLQSALGVFRGVVGTGSLL
uniref:Uncharacterized protein n=1 Tax=Arundo donax TaxID=35708 RepID=A0A0A8ZLH2_ARUDO